MSIKSYKWCANDAGVSLSMWKRMVRLGVAPPAIQVGLRRVGHEEADYHQWKASRRRVSPQPGIVNAAEADRSQKCAAKEAEAAA
jgi:hypothetical protein